MPPVDLRLAYSDEELGLAPLELDTNQDPAYQQNGAQRFLEGFSGLENMPQAAPRGFGEGFVGGLSRGLGSSGSRIAMERQKRESQIAGRQQERDRANLQATRDYRTQRASAVSSKRGQDATAAREEDRYNRANPPPGSPGYQAQMTRLTDEEKARNAGKPPEKAKQDREPIVSIEGPNGPVYVRQSEALGKAPARTTRTNQPVKGADRQALAYYNRGKQAIETLTSPDAKGASLEQRVSANLAGQIGLQFAPDWLKSPDARAYRQAQRAFTEARLRKESGAAIPPHEYEADAKTYFVQPGDDPAAIEQKRISRDVVLQGLAYGSGPAYEEFYGEKFQSGAAAGTPAPGTTESRTTPAASTVAKPGGWFASNKRKVGQ